MQVERANLTEIERELNLEKWIKNNNIYQFLFDLDDTICDTSPTFIEHKSQAATFLSLNEPKLTNDEWEKKIISIDNKLYKKFGVNPQKWNQIIDELNNENPISLETQIKTKEILLHIYQTPLKPKVGAEKILKFLSSIDMPIGIVTHGNKEWTWKKFNWLNLDRYINWDDVFIVNEDNPKNHDSWQEAINYFKIDPSNCAVIGDNPKSDINPAQKVGVKHCFLVENPLAQPIHQEEIASNVKSLKTLLQLFDMSI
ncbi:MAG: HAD family hydrolase [Candidatus Shapirobacteria bacterium]|nr:HAD family hydrolase [Candidatus Shapirobacteria bacterium]